MAFNQQKILIIHSQQPYNQYSGEIIGINDSEQFWMRKLAVELVEAIKKLGHIVILGPTGNSTTTYADNVKWVNNNKGYDFLISLHSNATATPNDSPKGIGIYYISNSGEALAKSLAPYLSKVATNGKATPIKNRVSSEITQTYLPALLVENEYHDWDGSATTGGAAWLRNSDNRTKLVNAYVAWLANTYGMLNSEPIPDPVVTGDKKFRFGTYNSQLAIYGGNTDYISDGNFIKKKMKCSVLALSEVNEANRNKILLKLKDFKVYATGYVALMWNYKKFDYGKFDEVSFGTYGARGIMTALTNKANNITANYASVHIRPGAITNLAGKKEDINSVIKWLSEYENVVVGGDWNTYEAKEMMENAGYVLASPIEDTLDKADIQTLDMIFIRGPLLVSRGGLILDPGNSSDHKAAVAKLTLKASYPVDTN